MKVISIFCAWLLLSMPLLAEEPKLRATLEGGFGILAFSPDGKTLAAAADDFIGVWDVATGKEIKSVKGKDDHIESVVFNPDGKTLATVGWWNTVKLWDLGTLEARTLFYKPVQGQCRERVVFSPDGKTLASSGAGHSPIKLWDLASGQNIANLDSHRNSGVNAMAFTPDSKTLVSVNSYPWVRSWNVAAIKEKRVALKPAETERVKVLIRKLGSDEEADRDKAEKELAAIGRPALELLRQAENQPPPHSFIDIRAGSLLELLEPDNEITVALKPAEIERIKRLIQELGSEEVSVRDKAEQELAAIGRPAYDLLRDAKGGENTRISDGANKLVNRLRAGSIARHVDWSTVVAISPNCETVALITEDEYKKVNNEYVVEAVGHIKIFSVATGKEVAALKGHAASVQTLAFSNDNMLLASGSEDGIIKLWDVAKGTELVSFKGHANDVTSLAFSQDGKTLASSGDRTIKLWDLAAGK